MAFRPSGGQLEAPLTKRADEPLKGDGVTWRLLRRRTVEISDDCGGKRMGPRDDVSRYKHPTNA